MMAAPPHARTAAPASLTTNGPAPHGPALADTIVCCAAQSASGGRSATTRSSVRGAFQATTASPAMLIATLGVLSGPKKPPGGTRPTFRADPHPGAPTASDGALSADRDSSKYASPRATRPV